MASSMDGNSTPEQLNQEFNDALSIELNSRPISRRRRHRDQSVKDETQNIRDNNNTQPQTAPSPHVLRAEVSTEASPQNVDPFELEEDVTIAYPDSNHEVHGEEDSIPISQPNGGNSKHFARIQAGLKIIPIEVPDTSNDEQYARELQAQEEMAAGNFQGRNNHDDLAEVELSLPVQSQLISDEDLARKLQAKEEKALMKQQMRERAIEEARKADLMKQQMRERAIEEARKADLMKQQMRERAIEEARKADLMKQQMRERAIEQERKSAPHKIIPNTSQISSDRHVACSNARLPPMIPTRKGSNNVPSTNPDWNILESNSSDDEVPSPSLQNPQSSHLGHMGGFGWLVGEDHYQTQQPVMDANNPLANAMYVLQPYQGQPNMTTNRPSNSQIPGSQHRLLNPRFIPRLTPQPVTIRDQLANMRNPMYPQDKLDFNRPSRRSLARTNFGSSAKREQPIERQREPDIRTRRPTSSKEGTTPNTEHRGGAERKATTTTMPEFALEKPSDAELNYIKELIKFTWLHPDNLGRDAVNLTHKSIEPTKVLKVSNGVLYNRYQATVARVGEVRLPPNINQALRTTHRDLGRYGGNVLQLDFKKEVLLFHGTEIYRCINIAQEGFNLNKALNGLYGKGIYLADSAQKADQYADAKDARRQTSLCIILCRVALGTVAKHTGGNPTRPGSVIAGKAIDNSKRFHEIVITNIDQCYPAFLIYYDRVKN